MTVQGKRGKNKQTSIYQLRRDFRTFVLESKTTLIDQSDQEAVAEAWKAFVKEVSAEIFPFPDRAAANIINRWLSASPQ